MFTVFDNPTDTRSNFCMKCMTWQNSRWRRDKCLHCLECCLVVTDGICHQFLSFMTWRSCWMKMLRPISHHQVDGENFSSWLILSGCFKDLLFSRDSSSFGWRAVFVIMCIFSHLVYLFNIFKSMLVWWCLRLLDVTEEKSIKVPTDSCRMKLTQPKHWFVQLNFPIWV